MGKNGPISNFVGNVSTTWTITTNVGLNTKKITARLNKDLSEGSKLALNLIPNNNISFTNSQTLNTIPKNIVTGIDSIGINHLNIIYQFSVTANIKTISRQTRSVIMTMTDNW